MYIVNVGVVLSSEALLGSFMIQFGRGLMEKRYYGGSDEPRKAASSYR